MSFKRIPLHVIRLSAAAVAVCSASIISTSLGYDRTNRPVVGLTRSAILIQTILYGISLPVLYYCNENDKQQANFLTAGAAGAALVGLGLGARTPAEIVMQYVTWGLLWAALASWFIHSWVWKVPRTAWAGDGSIKKGSGPPGPRRSTRMEMRRRKAKA